MKLDKEKLSSNKILGSTLALTNTNPSIENIGLNKMNIKNEEFILD